MPTILNKKKVKQNWTIKLYTIMMIRNVVKLWLLLMFRSSLVSKKNKECFQWKVQKRRCYVPPKSIPHDNKKPLKRSVRCFWTSHQSMIVKMNSSSAFNIVKMIIFRATMWMRNAWMFERYNREFYNRKKSGKFIYSSVSSKNET